MMLVVWCSLYVVCGGLLLLVLRVVASSSLCDACWLLLCVVLRCVLSCDGRCLLFVVYSLLLILIHCC